MEMTIGQRIRKKRKERLMTQQELGDIIGYSRAEVCGFERGTIGIKVETAIGIAEALGVSLNYLIFGKE